MYIVCTNVFSDCLEFAAHKVNKTSKRTRQQHRESVQVLTVERWMWFWCHLIDTYCKLCILYMLYLYLYRAPPWRYACAHTHTHTNTELTKPQLGKKQHSDIQVCVHVHVCVCVCIIIISMWIPAAEQEFRYAV